MCSNNFSFNEYFADNKQLANNNSKEIYQFMKIFEEIFINKRKLINLEFLKFDFKTYFFEGLIINLDFSITSYYKRDFNAAFSFILCSFKFLIIISEEKFEVTSEKFNNLFVDLFANLMEICSGYISSINNTQGINQAKYFGNHLLDLCDKFINLKIVTENKLLNNNFYFLKSAVDYLINYSMICLEPLCCYKSIELCEKVLGGIISIDVTNLLNEIDEENLKLENSSIFKKFAGLQNEYLNVTVSNFLQSICFSNIMAYLLTKTEKYEK